MCGWMGWIFCLSYGCCLRSEMRVRLDVMSRQFGDGFAHVCYFVAWVASFMVFVVKLCWSNILRSFSVGWSGLLHVVSCGILMCSSD